VICVPPCITSVEKRAVRESALSAGAREVYLIEEPMAAAIGAGLPITEPSGNMVVDIGGGTTEVAVISLGGIVTSNSLRIGGDELDEAIISHVKKEFSLLLGERTAEAIKLAIASVYPMEEELIAEIPGRDLVSGLPKTIQVTDGEIRAAIEEPVSAIIDTSSHLDRTLPARWRHHAQGHASPAAAHCCVGRQAPEARDRHAGLRRREPAVLRGDRVRQGSRSSRSSAGLGEPVPR
jgi:rod shape-determining protein MreB